MDGSSSSAFASGKMRLALALASGALLFLSSPAFGIAWLAWLALVPLLWAIDHPDVRPLGSFFLGWACGVVAAVGTHTVIVGMYRLAGELDFWTAVGLYLLLCSIHALGMGGWALLVHLLRHKAGVVWMAAVLFVLGEWLLPSLLPHHLANSQHAQLWMVQSLDLWGPLGISFMLAFCSTALWGILRAWLARHHPFPSLSLATCVLLIGLNGAYGVAAKAFAADTADLAPERFTVGVVQPNYSLKQARLFPEPPLHRRQQQTAEVVRLGAELVIWPQIQQRTWHLPVERPSDHALVVGEEASLTAPRSRATMVAPEHRQATVVWQARVRPFLDYLPWISPPRGRYAGERLSNALPQWQGRKLGVLLGHEDTHPKRTQELMQDLPHILVSLPNDRWMGRTPASTMHLALARMRAIEHRRFLVRSGNTGASAVFAPTGEVLTRTPDNARANLVWQVASLSGRTIFGRFGHWLGWLLSVALLMGLRRELTRLWLQTRRWLRQPQSASAR